MSTRANITLKTRDGKYLSVYSHWDGYLSGVGKLLLEYYNTEEKVKALVSLGDISSLDKSIEKPEGHTFDTKVEGYTVFYGRDRNEEDVDVREFDNFEALQSHWDDSWCEYSYLFKNGKWYYANAQKPLNKMDVLTCRVTA